MSISDIIILVIPGVTSSRCALPGYLASLQHVRWASVHLADHRKWAYLPNIINIGYMQARTHAGLTKGGGATRAIGALST